MVSPILSNIYLDKLDQFVEQVLIPEYSRGEERSRSKPYRALAERVYRKRKQGKRQEAKELFKQLQRMPSLDPNDPDYRRLYYIRYADDWLLGFIGPKEEAEEIKRRIREFLRDTLKLELSDEKTLITHATTQSARFLGYEITARHADDKHDQRGKRCINGRVALRLPADVLEKQCAKYMQRGRPIQRAEILSDSDYDIVVHYQSEYRGFVQYYLLAHNVSWLWKLHWIAETSLLKTLANKHKTSVKAMARKYKTRTKTAYGSVTCLEVIVPRPDKKPLIARFGGLALRRQHTAVLQDQVPRSYGNKRSQLIERLLADKCELCEKHDPLKVNAL